MASPVSRTVTVPVALDAEALKRQLAILRLLCSQIGFALDTAILALDNDGTPDDGC
jgi:hypothetical protein